MSLKTEEQKVKKLDSSGWSWPILTPKENVPQRLVLLSVVKPAASLPQEVWTLIPGQLSRKEPQRITYITHSGTELRECAGACRKSLLEPITGWALSDGVCPSRGA